MVQSVERRYDDMTVWRCDIVKLLHYDIKDAATIFPDNSGPLLCPGRPGSYNWKAVVVIKNNIIGKWGEDIRLFL